jgi:hypothetical protein
MHALFWLENQNGKDDSEDLGGNGEDNIRMDLREMEWTGCICLRIGSELL